MSLARRSPLDFAFIWWIALIGADRINLLGAHASFVLTPFIVLTPIVVAAEVIRHFEQNRSITVPRAGLGYAVLCTLLLATVFASVMASSAPSTSAARAALLFAQITGTFVVAILAVNRDDFAAVLARGALLGLVIFVAFDAVCIAVALGAIKTPVNIGFISVHLESFTYAGVIPRLSGPVADPNRAGWLLVFFGFAIAMGERRQSLRRAGVVIAVLLIALTLSRSAAFALVTTAFMMFIAKPIRVRPGAIAGASLAAAILFAALLFTPVAVPSSAKAVAPLAERFSVEEGSAKTHFSLLQRGLDEATATPGRIITGIGYGSSFTVLQDVFPGNRYGNFHSLFVTIFAECGFLALLLTLVLTGWPVIRGGAYRPLIAGAIAFSVFYQASAEPVFWFALALAWLHASRVTSH